MTNSDLNFFTQPGILRQIGPKRLALLLRDFTEDLNASQIVLPSPEVHNGDYFVQLAATFAATERLPERLHEALLTLENAASPANEKRAWTAIKRRIPCISMSVDCALDRVLDLWFAARDECSQFAPPKAEQPRMDSNEHELTTQSPTDATPQHSTTLPIHSSNIPSLQHSNTPPFHSSNTPPVPASESDQQAFARLGELSPAQYDRVRHAEAQRLQIRLETLDAEVAQARTELGYDAEARAVKLPAVEPWPEPVDGCEVLHQVRARFEGAVILPPGASQILALWPAHAHAFDAFLHTPRLNLTSAEAECGKTTTLDLLATLAPRSLRTENLTAPVLFRLVAKHQPTLLLDEVDTYLSFSQELRGLINAGHKQGGCAYRCEGRDNAVRAFNAFAPVVISGIGPLHETLRSRSIRLTLLKAEEEEQAELTARFDSRHTEIEAILCRKLARWARDNFAALKACDPTLPPGAYNRVADNWRPLFAIAQIAGGDWPQLTLEAYHHLTAPVAQASSPAGPQAVPARSSHQPSTTLSNHQLSTTNPQPLDVRAVELLADLREIITQSGATRLSSKQLVEALRTHPAGRYANLGTPHAALSWLARELQPFGINSRVLRIGTHCAKGYDLADFTEAFSRFLDS